MGKHSREKRERQMTGQVSSQAISRVPSSAFENGLLWIIKGGVLLTLFCPLIISKYSFFPFVTPKTIVFRILAEIVIGAYILLALTNSRYRPRFNSPLTIALSLFIFITVITSFTGINFFRSFWSTYERMTGLLTLFHLYGLYIVLISVFKKKSDWRWLLAASVAVGVLLSFYILLSDRASSRGGGTIGNTSFMATYLLFDIFFALILLLAESRPWKIYAGLALIPLIFNLITSSAQGAVVFFFAGLFLMAVGYLWFSKKKTFKLAAVCLFLGAILTIVLLVIFQPPFTNPTFNRVWGEMEPRFAVWSAGWQAWQAKFWLGWGPENFHVAFLKYFNPCMFTAKCGQEIWFDRTHNIILDTANASGLVGLISYLLIFGVAVVGLYLNSRQYRDRLAIFLPLGMMAGLLAYLGQNMLVFDMISSYLMFFVCLAFASFIAFPFQGEEAPVRRKVHQVWPWAVGSAALCVIIFFNIQPQMTAGAAAQMIARKGQPPEQTIPYFQKSLASWMLKYEPREQFLQIVAESTQEQQQKNKEATKQAFELAAAEIEKGIKENPTDFRTHLFAGRLYTSYYYFSSDKAKLERAQQVLQKALEMSPTNQQVYWYLAEIKFAETKYQEAIVILRQAVDLEPILGQSYWYLAVGQQLAGDYQAALASVETSAKVQQAYDWRDRATDLKRMIAIYGAVNDQAKVFSAYEEGVKRYPQDPQLWANLAPLYAQTSQFAKAQAAAKKFLELRPDLSSSVQEFLNKLPPPYNQL